MLNGGYHVYQIKRLSDNVIFTIGDIVKLNEGWRDDNKITKINVYGNQVSFNIQQNNSNATYTQFERFEKIDLKKSIKIEEIDNHSEKLTPIKLIDNRTEVFVDGTNEFLYSNENEKHTLYFNYGDQWHSNVKGTIAMQIINTGNGFKITKKVPQNKKNNLDYSEAIYLTILLKFLHKEYTFELANKVKL